MQSIRNISPVVRAIGVIGVVGILVTSITYAALQSQVTLTDNTVSSATADLQVDNTDNGTGFVDSDTGFTFSGVIPGGSASSSGNFQLKNTSTTVGMTIKVSVPTLPTWTVEPTSAVNNTMVNVHISCTDANETYTLNETLANLNAGPVSFTAGTLAPDDTATCTANISMLSDAFTGESASASNFDLVFTGTGV